MIKKIKYIINAYIALIIYFFTKNKYDVNTWIFGGHNGDLFDDNSRVLYEYVIDNKKDVKPYWVINKESDCIKEIESIGGRYLIKGSIKNFLYVYKSSVVIFSHALSADILPYSYILFGTQKIQKKIYKVFLTHGVDGFKCITFSKNKYTHSLQDKMIKNYDLILSVGDEDKKIKVNNWGINPNKISTIGMPRYDHLNYEKYEEKKEILYMPTWRNWLCENNVDICDSDYYQKVIDLITDVKLESLLESNNIKMNIYIHHFMQRYMKSFDIKLHNNIKILPINTSVQKKIIESALIITDYSSIAWDAAYMDKSILFYRFDIERYEKETGSYLNLREKILGDVLLNKNDLINKINYVINNNFKNKDESLNINKYFNQIDCNNSKRTIEKIETYLQNNKVV